jgi:hypothetical protein
MNLKGAAVALVVLPGGHAAVTAAVAVAKAHEGFDLRNAEAVGLGPGEGVGQEGHDCTPLSRRSAAICRLQAMRMYALRLMPRASAAASSWAIQDGVACNSMRPKGGWGASRCSGEGGDFLDTGQSSVSIPVAMRSISVGSECTITSTHKYIR